MRPPLLQPLFAATTSLKGVGSRVNACLSVLMGGKNREPILKDLLFHLPIGYVDRRTMPNLLTAPDGSVITAVVTIEEMIEPNKYSRQPLKIVCRNETGYITLVFFNVNANYISRELPLGKQRVISGKVERFDSMLQMVHPDLIMPVTEIEKVLRMEPRYALTKGLTHKSLGKLMDQALEKAPDLQEWIEQSYLKQQKWTSWKSSLHTIHHPQKPEDTSPESPAWQRLAYDELLANQLALAITRGLVRKKSGRVMQGDGTLQKQLRHSLPFSLTAGQEASLKEIINDMTSDKRMLRLLQGDVGSGKTVLALLAMLNAIEAGTQAALMAPTEILARQHMAWISEAIEQAGISDHVNVTLLTGRDKGKARETILSQLYKGEIQIIIGTHALFQEKVEFHNLGMVVIDEQHRFGVRQRLLLSQKGKGTDILLMSATPIPRTLLLTYYGDMEVSSLKEKPAGRHPIDTRIISQAREQDIMEGLKRAIAEGNRIYWVCPLIEGTMTDDAGEPQEVTTAEERFTTLRKYFGEKVGLVHGRKKAEEKDQIMEAFKQGTLNILVATTVIEVGVDVPEATVMIIEHAEYFGLSQLHQLRGRVGRGEKPSTCILLYGRALSETGKKRLQIMRETEDGFKIAEEDLVLRGGGNVLGTQQSGAQNFQLAAFPEHSSLLFAARDDVKMVMEKDPSLASERGQNLRTLLYLYEYDAHMRYLMSG